MKKRRAAKKQARPKDIAISKKRASEESRTIGQILIDGPQNYSEQAKLNQYEAKRKAFYTAHFSKSKFSRQLILSAVEQSLQVLSLTRSEFRNAIQTKHRTGSRALLDRIAQRARELLELGKVQPSAARNVGSALGSTRLIGFGGCPADCCQLCGRYLTAICYSQVANANRVPRTDKICGKCFSDLSQGEKELYHKYCYRHRPEPRGVGWKPDGEWAN